MSDLMHCRTCGKSHPELVEVCTCDLESEVSALRNRVIELEMRVTEYKALQALHDTELEMQCAITAANQKKQTEEACVNAILNGSQFFLGGIEPEMREAVVRRALDLN